MVIVVVAAFFSSPPISKHFWELNLSHLTKQNKHIDDLEPNTNYTIQIIEARALLYFNWSRKMLWWQLTSHSCLPYSTINFHVCTYFKYTMLMCINILKGSIYSFCQCFCFFGCCCWCFCLCFWFSCTASLVRSIHLYGVWWYHRLPSIKKKKNKILSFNRGALHSDWGDEYGWKKFHQPDGVSEPTWMWRDKCHEVFDIYT